MISPIQNISASSSDSSLSSLEFEGLREKTIYERVLSIYSRDEEYNLVTSKDFGDSLKNTPVMKLYEKGTATEDVSSMRKTVVIRDGFHSFIIWEKERSATNMHVGVITDVFEPEEFDLWFLDLLVSTTMADFVDMGFTDSHNVTGLVTGLFERILKKTARNDQWDSQGREFFEQRIDFFSSRGIEIQAILPAFPCKSSNTDKVASVQPDKGEELALRKLLEFAGEVNKIYAPGIAIWIVSDGHVFSDCIGVDDTIVDEYSKELQKMYKRLDTSGLSCIKFCSLKDIFKFDRFPITCKKVENSSLEHHLGTEIDEEAELCRKALVYSCDTDAGQLKKDIKTENHPRLHLYRGFSKFMEQDLVTHPLASCLSRKKYKKLISKVAFEMIKRNDAYSNLVELMFPMSLRVSIHAHSNSGPKFGINLLDSTECKVVSTLEQQITPDFDDLLHIPTPWHNCVAKIQEKNLYLVTVSEVIKKALEKGIYSGSWNKEEGYFLLSQV